MYVTAPAIYLLRTILWLFRPYKRGPYALAEFPESLERVQVHSNTKTSLNLLYRPSYEDQTTIGSDVDYQPFALIEADAMASVDGSCVRSRAVIVFVSKP